ncbi:MAG: hypothetical protein LBT84_03225 [Spirochaetia bacterium]|jgi:SAM-dependent methyltransferase|nr:hypothetical protein [Spirochaetia bacterium]
MSLEICGNAEKNFDSIYIDPNAYKQELRNAILAMRKRGLNASIYNTPLCFCHEDIRQFARASISSWKNIFHENCSPCSLLSQCSGFFATSSNQASRNISPILDVSVNHYNLDHKKPKNQDPSPILKKYISKIIKNIDAPVLDVACGYGINGALIASYKIPVIFLDKSDKALNFIAQGENLCVEKKIIDNTLIKTIKHDLINDGWPFEKNYLGGIINVQFYYLPLITEFINSLKIGGFIYIESVSAIAGNYLILPEYKYIINKLDKSFSIIYYKERQVKPLDRNVATIKLLAQKLL